jgi:predicted ATPase/DNA-binding CsgD family transcriptional regulator
VADRSSSPEVSAVSAREAEVLALLGLQRSNAQIARQLHISVRTVESHVSSLLRKYGAEDRQALARISGPHAQGVAAAEIGGLPHATTSFVGREEELVDVGDAVEASRLVTLVGPGGVGKSRLAAAFTQHRRSYFPGGGSFVNLVPVEDGLVLSAVAASLDVAESTGQPLELAVMERLRQGRALLVLDNCEHLMESLPVVVDRLLTSCPELRVLATSRERLGVAGERVVAVSPLPIDADAITLFRERAEAAGGPPDLPHAVVSDVCARLDGNPLAIELAAARSASLGAEGLLATASDAMRLLSGGRGADPRHRSLAAVIGWSYNLLGADERLVFRRLAVFASTFDLGAVDSLVPELPRVDLADLLGRLVDKSLVVPPDVRSGHWRLLDTIRAFAEQKLRADAEWDAASHLHLVWATSTATGLREAMGEGWRATFDAVVDDLRAALGRATPDDQPLASELATAMAGLSYARRFLREAFTLYRSAAVTAASPSEAGLAFRDAADCSFVVGVSGDETFELLLEAATAASNAQDPRSQAISLARAVEFANRHPATFAHDVPQDQLDRLLAEAVSRADPGDLQLTAQIAIAQAWNARGRQNDPRGDLADHAVRACRATGDPVLVSAALDALGTAARGEGHFRQAQQLTKERLSLLEAMDRHAPYAAPEILDTHRVAAADALMAGQLRDALDAARLALQDELLGPNSYISLAGLIPPLVLSGSFEESLRHAQEMWEGWHSAGRPAAGWMAPAVSLTALAHELMGDSGGRALWLGRVREAAGPEAGHRFPLASDVFVDARTAIQRGDFTQARAIVDTAFGDFRGARFEGYARAAGAELAVTAGLGDAEERLESALATAGENAWAIACLTRARGRLECDGRLLDTAMGLWEDVGSEFELGCTRRLIEDMSA